jgi:hypothetical protein
MKKDELIEALQKIEGKPEVYMSAFVWEMGDYTFSVDFVRLDGYGDIILKEKNEID